MKIWLTSAALSFCFFSSMLLANNTPQKTCDEELKKEQLDSKALTLPCSQAAKNLEQSGDYDRASWYYLLAGKYEKNIQDIQPKVEDFYSYANIASSYLLTGKTEQAQTWYKKFLRFAPVPDVDPVMRGDFDTFKKLFPNKKMQIQTGIDLWAELFKPLESTIIYLEDYNKAGAAKDYDTALQSLQKILTLQNQHQDPNNTDRLDNLLTVGMLHNQLGQYKESITHLLNAEKAYEQLGSEQEFHVNTVNWLANTYNNLKQYDKAEQYYKKLVTLKESLFSEEAIELVPIYSEVAGFYQQQANYQASLSYYKKLNTIYAKQGLSDDVSIVPFYINFASLYTQATDYQKALEIQLKSLHIREKAIGTDHIDTADSLNSVGIAYKNLEQYDKALEYYKKSLTIREKELGTEHELVAQNYNNIANAYSSILDFEKALENNKEAMLIYEKTLGKNHPETALSYNNTALLYTRMGEYENAEALYKKTIAIREKKFGTDDIETALSYNDVAVLYLEMNHHKQALEYLEKAKTIREKKLGKKHNDTATSYNNIAQVLEAMGDYTLALTYQLEALDIYKAIWGDEHKRVASAYGNLGAIYQELGQYDKALGYYNQSLTLRQTLLGKDHLDTATSHNNLATYYLTMGDYAAAIEHNNIALTTRKKILGDKHPKVAQMHNNLGAVYYFIGDFEQALNQYKIALTLLENAFGKKHIEVGIAYNNIGLAHLALHQYDEALKNNKKALAITEKRLGKNHPEISVAYNNLSEVYSAQGDNKKALELSKQVLSIRLKSLGEEHPLTARAYGAIAVNYQQMGKHKKAKDNYLKELALEEKILGTEHIDTINTVSNLGTLYSAMGDSRNYYLSAKKSFDFFEKNRAAVFSVLDAKQKNKYLKNNTYKVGLLLSSTKQHLTDLQTKKQADSYQTVLQTSMNDWLNYKGSLFDSENAITRLSSSGDATVKGKLEQLIQQKRQLAKLYQSLPKPKERQTWQKNIKATEASIIALNKELKALSKSAGDSLSLTKIYSKDIANHLKADELYLDFARTDSFYYLFILDHQNNIHFIQYDSENTTLIDTLLASFRTDVETITSAEKLSDDDLVTLSQKSQKTLAELYDSLIGEELDDVLKDKKSLIISSDGALRLLPIEALYHAKTKQYFIEEKSIRYISSGRELARIYQQEEQPKADNVVVFANPDFDLDLASKAKTSDKPTGSRAGIIRSLFKMRFSPLQGTKEEAKAIEAILPKGEVKEYLQAEATESNLFDIKQAKILHIATHGFFLNEASIPNPMLKSGVALSGANTSAIRGRSDGIVTALKLSGMQLQGTELVVLSACETGVVDKNSTDTISGLSKAFILAGARNIVMSLWSVADKETKDLMAGFYQQIEREQSYANALRNSKLDMIKQEKHPYYWAAFIINGGD